MMNKIDLNRLLNILMIAPTMFFADYGGHIRILEEARVLRHRGHQITILTYPNGRDIDDLDIHRCLGVPFNYRVEVGSSRHKYYLDIMLSIRSACHALTHKPDIIHAHMHEGALIGWVMSKLTGAPLVFDFQGSLTGEMLDHNFLRPGGKRHRFFQWLESRIDHMAQVILPSSRQAAQLLQTDFQIPLGRIHPIPDCVSSQIFNPLRFPLEKQIVLKQALGLPLNKQLIVYAGLLTTYQGIDLLLEALQLEKQKRDDFHLLIMGFPSVEHYRAKTQALGLQSDVTFTGMMPYEHLPAHLALGDIAIAPKLSDTEGCGKILNYMSMALPTIAFETPVSREYLGVHGFYAQKRNAEALARVIDTTLNLSAETRKYIGQVLRQCAIDTYSWERAARQIETVYAAILAGHPQPAFAVEQAAI